MWQRVVQWVAWVGLGFWPTLGLGQQAGEVVQQREVAFATSDGGRVDATLYGTGNNAVVLAHGGVFDKSSWNELSTLLAERGLRVLAINFRGYGKSEPGSQPTALYQDVLAAVRYLRENGADRVSVVGASMGGGAAAKASVESRAGEIDRLILLAHVPIERPQDLQGNKLFIVSRGDRLSDKVKQQFDAAPQPKKLVVLDGSAHAQHVFRSEQADTLTQHLVDWLDAPHATKGSP